MGSGVDPLGASRIHLDFPPEPSRSVHIRRHLPKTNRPGIYSLHVVGIGQDFSQVSQRRATAPSGRGVGPYSGGNRVKKTLKLGAALAAVGLAASACGSAPVSTSGGGSGSGGSASAAAAAWNACMVTDT